MTPHAPLDPRRLEPWFRRAHALPPEARDQLLDDAALTAAERQRVRAMLAAADADAHFLEPPRAAARDDAWRVLDDAALAGARFGAYELTGVLARGGMGTVYRARRADGAFERAVAIKTIRRALVTPALISHFENERQLLARLDHPAITRLLDGGTTDDGTPYLVMDAIDGAPIDVACRDRALPLRARLAVLIELCRAVQHAHAHLIVHLDLTPANVLLTRDGAVKVLDFGVAQLLHGADRATPIAVTPRFASPELRDDGNGTTRSDLYALGRVIECVLRDAALSRPQRRDARAIIARATAADPAARYPTAEALANDLERARDRRAVRARNGEVFLPLRCALRRHRRAVTFGSAAVVVTTALLAQSWQRTVAAEAHAVHAHAATRDAMTVIEECLVLTNPYVHGPGTPYRDAMRRAEALIAAQCAARPEVEAQVRLALARTQIRLDMLADATPNLDRACALLEATGRAAPTPERDLALAEALSLRGLCRMERSWHEPIDTRDAVIEQERALTLADPHLPAAHPLRARLLTHRGIARWAAAKADPPVEAIRRDYVAARKMLAACGALGTADDARLATDQGHLAWRYGTLADAERWFASAIEIYATLAPRETRLHIEALTHHAAIAAARGAPERALASLEQLRAVMPAGVDPERETRAAVHRALLHARLGAPDQVRTALRAAATAALGVPDSDPRDLSALFRELEREPGPSPPVARLLRVAHDLGEYSAALE